MSVVPATVHLLSLLSEDALSPAEASAAVLDGELFPIAAAFRPIDLPDDAAARAEALTRVSEGRWLLGGRTAAWVWGAGRSPGPPYELWIAPDAPGHSPMRDDARVREIALRSGDVVALGEVRLTSPVRTALALACEPPTAFDANLLGCLCRLQRIPRELLLAELEERGRLPGRRLAARRLQVLLTR